VNKNQREEKVEESSILEKASLGVLLVLGDKRLLTQRSPRPPSKKQPEKNFFSEVSAFSAYSALKVCNAEVAKPAE
jgi:hypothetical protein